ncbi:hypothetical protein GCM10007860_15870 [Chitiniphilus shinanonensis]|uniref:DUF2061 domain-containing protein n=2 Tax=Chitiniphilus shinanonensis TaxID=553088 RepID=A0ABQ6BR08_9NEIS|nr:hypothetical protein GCM10007860_15870 [Chitiniphilus shinanonensis]
MLAVLNEINPVNKESIMVKACEVSSGVALHLVVGFSVTYAMTGSIAAGGLVALVEPLCMVVAHHFHDKVWHGIKARRQPQPQTVAA